MWDTAQAFCSSITGTLAHKAVIKGLGVGDATATAAAATLTHLLRDATSKVGKIWFTYAQVSRCLVSVYVYVRMCPAPAFIVSRHTCAICNSAFMRIMYIVTAFERTSYTSKHIRREVRMQQRQCVQPLPGSTSAYLPPCLVLWTVRCRAATLITTRNSGDSLQMCSTTLPCSWSYWHLPSRRTSSPSSAWQVVWVLGVWRLRLWVERAFTGVGWDLFRYARIHRSRLLEPAFLNQHGDSHGGRALLLLGQRMQVHRGCRGWCNTLCSDTGRVKSSLRVSLPHFPGSCARCHAHEHSLRYKTIIALRSFRVCCARGS